MAFVAMGAERVAAQVGPKGASTPVRAVVELYTSQGCSSCPKADLLLQELASRPGIIALTMPVDYWDYLGWRDTFASSANSERQRKLARARGDGMIFTPQMVVNGFNYVNGNRRAEVEATIAKFGTDLSRVPLKLASSADRLLVEIGTPVEPVASGDDTPDTDAAILVGAVRSHAEVKVRGGENGGRVLTYANVVYQLIRVGTWKHAAMKLEVDRTRVMSRHADGCVAILQESGASRIVSATLLAKC